MDMATVHLLSFGTPGPRFTHRSHFHIFFSTHEKQHHKEGRTHQYLNSHTKK
jgi:hypothetical protein